ncbi:MAG: MarR family winged helix-turn-helix transcriptional regulator [Candidatus Saccharibacteria bacterium]
MLERGLIYSDNLFESIEAYIPAFLESLERFMTPPSNIDVEISRYELLALLMLDQWETTNMSGLAQWLSVPMSTATGIADRMDKKGLIMRAKAEDDRRAINLVLTENGRGLVSKYKFNIKCLIDKMSTNLTKEEFQMATILMRKMLAGLRNKPEE